MRIVWITPHDFEAAMGGGAFHEYEVLRSLVDRHEIHVITAPEHGTPELDRLNLTHESVEYVRQEHPESRLGMAWAMLRAEPTLLFWLRRDRLRALSEALARAQDAGSVDLVHATHGELAPVLHTARAPTSLLLFDSRVRDKERQLELETLPRRRLQNRAERRRSVRWERRWYSGLDGLAAVSPLDAAVTSRLLGRPVEVLPNPVPGEFFETPRVARTPGTVTFVGTLSYPPNLDAVAWLARDIWPLIRARFPNALLRIVGRAEGDIRQVPGLGEALERAGATVATNVPDILPWYWESAVVVAPLRLGSGLRNKVIHAMAAGAPVVATPAALEGIEVSPGENMLVGSTSREVADRVVELLADPERARTLADRARAFAARFRSDVVTERVDAWLRDAASARGRRSG